MMVALPAEIQAKLKSDGFVDRPKESCRVVGYCCRGKHNTVACGMSEWGCMVMKMQAWGWSYRDMKRASGLVASAFSEMKTDPEYQPFYHTGIRFRRLYVRAAIEQRKKRVAAKESAETG